jgi:hypothetical protein
MVSNPTKWQISVTKERGRGEEIKLNIGPATADQVTVGERGLKQNHSQKDTFYRIFYSCNLSV